MLGIAICCIQHSQAMLERGVCELAHSFFHENKDLIKTVKSLPKSSWTAAVEQWVRTFASQSEGRVFESQSRQTQVVGTDSSTAKRSAIGVSVTGPRR